MPAPRLAGWPLVALLVFGYVACQIGFGVRSKRLPADAPDVKFGYSSADLRETFDAWQAEGRSFYCRTQLLLDVPFPLIYGSLFASLSVRLMGCRGGRAWAVVPAMGAAADLSENAALVWMAANDAVPEAAVAWASASTQVKFVLFGLSLLQVGVLAVWAWLRPCPEPASGRAPGGAAPG